LLGSETQQPVGQGSRQLTNKDSPLKSFLGGHASFYLTTFGGPSEILLTTPKTLVES
jgi:hypothetical protein